MISAGDFRNGVTFDMDGNVYQIIEFQHVKPGKGAAFVRAKIRNVIAGSVVERTFNPSDKFPTAYVERKEMEYSYNDGDLYYFMDLETYELLPISKAFCPITSSLSRRICPARYVIQRECFRRRAPQLCRAQGNPDRTRFKGDPATNVTKPCTLETGAEIRIPLFIEEGEMFGWIPYRRIYGTRITKSLAWIFV